jgi:carboxymethylenebutenolidase
MNYMYCSKKEGAREIGFNLPNMTACHHSQPPAFLFLLHTIKSSDMSAANKIEDQLPLPSAPAIEVSSSVTIQPPLSRCGKGPTLVILVDEESAYDGPTSSIDPPPLQKWAEESYAVGQINISRLSFSGDEFGVTLAETIKAIQRLPSHDGNEKVGIISKLMSL